MSIRETIKALAILLTVANVAQANLSTLSDSSAGNLSPTSGEHSFLGSVKWAPGLNSASTHAAGLGPGGASWSPMPSGVGFVANEALPSTITTPHPLGNLSTDIEFLITAGNDGLEYSLFHSAFNVWAAATSITNLGQVADGGSSALAGGLESTGGHLGDIRVAGYQFGSSPTPGGTLAHGFAPLTQALGGPGGTIGGDIHFDTAENWSDDPTDTNADSDFDFFTVALHELGHALGLGHSTIGGSVMEATYAGARRTLSADDIAGIQALYSAPAAVPEPSAFLFGCVLVTFGLIRKRK